MGKYLPSDEEGIRGKYLKRDEKLKRKGGRRKRYFVSGEEKKGEGKGGQSFGDDVNFDYNLITLREPVKNVLAEFVR